MEVPGVMKKVQEEFPGVNEKHSGTSRGERGIARDLNFRP